MSVSQAKLTWLGSDTTLEFRHAVVIWLVTVATLGGHDGPCLSTIIAPTMSTTRTTAVPMPIGGAPERARRAGRRPRRAGRRPCSMRVWARSEGLRGLLAGPGRVCPAFPLARSISRSRRGGGPWTAVNSRVRDSRHSVSSCSRSSTLSSRSEYHSSSLSIKFSNSLLVVITPDPWPDPGCAADPRPRPGDGQRPRSRVRPVLTIRTQVRCTWPPVRTGKIIPMAPVSLIVVGQASAAPGTPGGSGATPIAPPPSRSPNPARPAASGSPPSTASHLRTRSPTGPSWPAAAGWPTRS